MVEAPCLSGNCIRCRMGKKVRENFGISIIKKHILILCHNCSTFKCVYVWESILRRFVVVVVASRLGEGRRNYSVQPKALKRLHAISDFILLINPY
jgi:hypothetical protein